MSTSPNHLKVRERRRKRSSTANSTPANRAHDAVNLCTTRDRNCAWPPAALVIVTGTVIPADVTVASCGA
ncbi:MAG: hypothetical protein ACXVZX_11145, partial [Terriglobales bacterium]